MKPWYKSKTILGTLLSALGTVAAVFGVQITPDMQAELATAIPLAITGAGTVLAIFGRLRAQVSVGLGKGNDGGVLAILVAGVLSVVLLAACAAPVADTPAQRVYAAQSDYAAAQLVALAYIENPSAKPAVVTAIRTADALAHAALAKAQAAARDGDDPAAPALIAAADQAVRRLVILTPAPHMVTP